MRARGRRAGAHVTDGTPLLEVSGLHVHYPGREGPARAVDGVDLAVREGETIALVGESGCGKTTLARTIMGLNRPDAGEVRFRGEPLGYGRAALREHRRRAQMIFQDPTGALNARQTLYEAVAEGIRIQGLEGDEEELVARALSRAGLRPPCPGAGGAQPDRAGSRRPDLPRPGRGPKRAGALTELSREPRRAHRDRARPGAGAAQQARNGCDGLVG